jgi:hypothetical protein
MLLVEMRLRSALAERVYACSAVLDEDTNRYEPHRACGFTGYRDATLIA